MKATQVLIEEHEAVNVMLDVFAKIIEKAKRGDEVNKAHLDSILEFLQVFVDKCHHVKEEKILIPMVQGLNMEDSDWVVETIKNDHIQGRSYISGIKEGLEKYKNGDNAGLNLIVENGILYIHLLDKHIEMENTILFKKSDDVLSKDQQNKMYAEFERIEEEEIGEGTHERLHKVIDKLKNIYLN